MISHTKRIWDNISLKSNKDILLTGIGVYLPYTKDCEALICVDARPLEKPLRPLDVETQLDSIDDAYTWGTTTIFAKVNIMQIVIVVSIILTEKLLIFSTFRYHSIWNKINGGKWY